MKTFQFRQTDIRQTTTTTTTPVLLYYTRQICCSCRLQSPTQFQWLLKNQLAHSLRLKMIFKWAGFGRLAVYVRVYISGHDSHE